MHRRLAAALVVTCVATACLHPARLNHECRFDDALSAPLDLARATDRRHLRDDALIAEELGVRLGDRYRGQKSIPERQALREGCRDSLFAVIARAHAVSLVEVQTAPGWRNLALDVLLLVVPMLALLYAVATRIVDRVRRRFDHEERVAAFVSNVLLSGMISGLWLAVGNLWAWLVEMVRLRDQHLSFRAARIPWGRHVPELFVIGVLCYWWVAWRRRRGTAMKCGSV
jgi:hypothetical protein